MSDEMTFTLHNPLTEEEWDMITDVDLDHTSEITFHTKNGKEVVFVKRKLPSVQPDITDEQAIGHLQASGWMQSHDKQMYKMGLKERLADDSDSYDALLPSSQPEIIRCKDCMHNGSYDTDCPIDWNGKEYCSFAERITDEGSD